MYAFGLKTLLIAKMADMLGFENEGCLMNFNSSRCDWDFETQINHLCTTVEVFCAFLQHILKRQSSSILQLICVFLLPDALILEMVQTKATGWNCFLMTYCGVGSRSV